MPRLFVAARVPSNDTFERVLTQLGAVRGVKAVSPVNLHYTLRFLGDVADDVAHVVRAAFDQAEAPCPAFGLDVVGTSAFPDTDRPRVIWAGCDEAATEPFAALARATDDLVDRADVAPRDKLFVPHLTLARLKVRGGRGADDAVALIKEHKHTRYGHVHVDRIHLVESTLTPAGPTYDDVAEVTLA